MQNIKVAREQIWLTEDGKTREVANCFIEPDDRSWIIFLTEEGRPYLYFAQREADGAVIGEGVQL